MEVSELVYPAGPINPDPDIIKPTSEFIKQVYRSVGAILLFIVTYILLLIVVLGLAAGACVLGVALIKTVSSGMVIIFGAGIIAAGLMLVYFVIKFMFKRSKMSYQGMVQISHDEQPELFEFINRVAKDTGAPKPKKIFISLPVNASVFYTSSFWSMFFPVGKNLNIGLGLVDAVNVSEFKAVMAHEFGHFSQRSMKFGSYVYNFNKVVYSMLYDNDGYINALNRMASVHGIFYLFAKLNYWIVIGIQKVLRGVYIIVNKTYLKLSREMEFHADAMAAFASGSNNAISSFRRITIASACYDNLLDYWNYKFEDNKRALNFFRQHQEVIKLYAKDNNLAVDTYGLPVLEGDAAVLKSSDLVIEEQWSSHPSNEDRERRLAQTGIMADVVSHSAWLLFRDREALQQRLTDTLYENTVQKPGIAIVDVAEFVEEFTKDIADNSYNPEYKGYYNNRNIIQFDLDTIITDGKGAGNQTFAEIFSIENTSIPKTISRLEHDRLLLDSIKADKDIKTFDYKGVKYQNDDAGAIQVLIDKEILEKQQQLEDLDRQAFLLFYNDGDEAQRSTLKDKYMALYKYQQAAEKDYQLYGEAIAAMRPVYSKMKPDQIKQTLAEVYRIEIPLRQRLTEFIADDEIKQYITAEQVKEVDKYISRKILYHDDGGYNNYAIKNFNTALSIFISVINQRIYMVKKDLLNFQFQMLQNN